MTKSKYQTIDIHPLAPEKPQYGERCNGCGVCCAAEPCPVAYVFLLQFSGSCRALIWQDEAKKYACGMVVYPDRFVWLIPKIFRKIAGRFFSTRISSGSGCDSSV